MQRQNDGVVYRSRQNKVLYNNNNNNNNMNIRDDKDDVASPAVVSEAGYDNNNNRSNNLKPSFYNISNVLFLSRCHLFLAPD